MNDRERCYRILYECYENGAFSNLLMSDPDITGFVRASVYGTLTYTYSEDYFIRKVSGKDTASLDPEVRTILRFGAWQLLFSDKVPDYAAVSSTVELASKHQKHAAGFVNAVLRRISGLKQSEKNIGTIRDPEAAFSLKPEIYGVIKKSAGKERAPKIARALLEPPALTVRANTLRCSSEDLSEILRSESFDVRRSDIAKDGLILIPSPDSPSVSASTAYKRGLLMVQGAAAQLVSEVCAPSPGMRIIDLCSAPGGKTTHLAQLSGDKADITALDINASRLELVKENAKRLGIGSVKTMKCDSSLFEDGEGYDLVLCDAPCSGLGIMGMKPDIRLTISYARILEIIERQALILRNAGRLVRKDGALVYSTCTINSEENEAQVEAFLRENDDFEPEDLGARLPERLRDRGKDGMLTLLPDEDGCEGFFISKLRRVR